jgi:DNA-binding beta-propeller fold protein YncE
MRCKRTGLLAMLTAVLGAGALATGTASAAPSTLSSPVYESTLIGPGQADMYPVDVDSNSTSSQSCTSAASGCYYFVLDAGNYRLLAVNRVSHAIDWQIGGQQGNNPLAGSPSGSLPIQFSDARAVAYDSATSDVYVADTANNRVLVFSFSPTAGFSYLTQFGSKGTANGEFSEAYGVAVDAANRWVYVVDGAGRVEKFSIGAGSTPTFTYLGSFGTGTLHAPRQVAVAPNGDVLVMNRPQNKTESECYVYQATSTSALLEFGFGSSGKGNGEFTDDPRGVAVSADGTLAFATDSGGKRVEVFDLTQSGGHYTSAAWAATMPQGTGNGAFVGPRGLTVTANNDLLLTDEWGYNLHEYSFSESPTFSDTSTWQSTPTAPPVPGVNAPRGLGVAANGAIYVMDYWNQRVEYGTLGSGGTIQGAQAFGMRGDPDQDGAINFAWSIALQPGTGDVFIANRESNQIEACGPTGLSCVTGGAKGTALGDFSFPQGIAFAPDGELFISDTGNDRIEGCTVTVTSTLSLTGCVAYGSKGTGSTAPAGDLNQPTGIAVSPDGSTLWVADTLNNRVQTLSLASHTWSTPIHKLTGKGAGILTVPWGVTVAPDGSIWVSDTGNNRIVSMSTTGALNFSATGAQMGVPESYEGNQTVYPFAIAFGSGDTVYLSDTWNNRVLVLAT